MLASTLVTVIHAVAGTKSGFHLTVGWIAGFILIGIFALHSFVEAIPRPVGAVLLLLAAVAFLGLAPGLRHDISHWHALHMFQ